MSDITTSAIQSGCSSPAPNLQTQQLGTSLPTGGGTVGETTNANATSRVSENARVSQSQLTILDQRTQPQDAVAFGMMLLAAMLLSDKDDESKSNPLKMLLGLALLSGLQQHLQGGQTLHFESQTYDFNQSTTTTESLSSQQATYQQSTGGGGGGGGADVGTQIDVQG